MNFVTLCLLFQTLQFTLVSRTYVQLVSILYSLDKMRKILNNFAGGVNNILLIQIGPYITIYNMDKVC